MLVTEFLLKRATVGGSIRADLEMEDGSPVLRLRAPVSDLEPETAHLLLEPYRVADLAHHGGEGLLDLPLAAELMRNLQGGISANVRPDGDIEIRIRFPQTPDRSLWARDDSEDMLKDAA